MKLLLNSKLPIRCFSDYYLLSGQTLMGLFRRFAGLLFIVLLQMGCERKSIEFETFDSSLWAAEGACKEYRMSVIEAMEEQFDQFLGMNETELIQYLGNPDETHLYTRGQKFFTYRLTCADSTSNTKILRIRFSALDQINEVLVLD
ncbi:MAG: hypothetical protein ABJF11_18560 [Reichenbachiella sp.]|uniref:hypothetical protein n=1 Tax=Reichenbachiella sp. TaxID=2184521 RepID=UPI003264AD29